MGSGKHKCTAKTAQKTDKKAKYYDVADDNEDEQGITGRDNEKKQPGEGSIGGGGIGISSGDKNAIVVHKSVSELTKPVRTSFSVTSRLVNHVSARSIPVEVQCDGDSHSLETSVCCADWFEACHKKSCLGYEYSLHDMDLLTYVHNELFPKLKFFMDAHQLMFLSMKDTMCYQICRDMKVKEICSAAWWELYKTKIVQTLNNKRADVTMAMK